MKLGFICPNLPGHINPMSSLARHLQTRNHEVVFLYSPSANGLPCVLGEKRDDMNANRPEMSKLEGNSALQFYIGVATDETERILESLPKMVAQNGIDALIIDPVQFQVELGPKKLGIPYVTVANAFYFDYFGHTHPVIAIGPMKQRLKREPEIRQASSSLPTLFIPTVSRPIGSPLV